MNVQLLGVIGLYSHTNEISLEGNAQELQELANCLSTIPSEVRFRIPESISPKPYDGFLTKLKILHSNDYLLIDRQEYSLVLKGSIKNFNVLGRSIINLANSHLDKSNPVRRHIHIEYIEGDYFLAPSPFSLTVSLDHKF